MARIFAYIVHKGGVADDSAAELAGRGKKDRCRCVAHRRLSPVGARSWMPFATASALLTARYGRSRTRRWPIPNAELVRKALVSVLPARLHLLVPHAHFGVDLSPGLSIKMNAAYVSDVVDIEGRRRDLAQSGPPGIRRTGERACSLRYFLRRGDQHPSGRIQAAGERCRRRAVVDKSSEVGASDGGPALSGDGRRRGGRCRYHQAAGSGLHRPRHPGTGQRGHRRRNWPMPWARR